jgi:hypothetical protein
MELDIGEPTLWRLYKDRIFALIMIACGVSLAYHYWKNLPPANINN